MEAPPPAPPGFPAVNEEGLAEIAPAPPPGAVSVPVGNATTEAAPALPLFPEDPTAPPPPTVTLKVHGPERFSDMLSLS